MKALLGIVKQNKGGQPAGIYSVCSSHPLVIEASLRHALANGESVLIEATSNQVNQDGGYTGMRPTDFREMVYSIANEVGLATERVMLGGDHLGPNCWQDLSAEEAMAKSDVLIAQYVEAGFRKIHLDCSMSCSDDPVPLGDAEVATRAARLCKVAETAWKKTGGAAPAYIVGTEVPVPGGAQENLDELALTTVEAASQTIEIHKEAFAKEGLEDTWNRVIGLVVQPGVEFDHHKIVAFAPEKAVSLSGFVKTQPHLVYEAHSTDYQSAEHLAELVKGHFAILKVGPWLTFAMREACWALDLIEQTWIEEDQRANLRKTILHAMQDDPKHWRKYYASEGKRQTLDMEYSLSDRIRYYWPVAEVETALSKLIDNLNANLPPLTLISQYLPNQAEAIVAGSLELEAKQIIFHKISEVLKKYSSACNTNELIE